jgi:hypothetical protein
VKGAVAAAAAAAQVRTREMIKTDEIRIVPCKVAWVWGRVLAGGEGVGEKKRKNREKNREKTKKKNKRRGVFFPFFFWARNGMPIFIDVFHKYSK